MGIQWGQLIDTVVIDTVRIQWDTMGSDPMVKKSFRDTLRARGVCSRIPHSGVSSTPTHGQISTHVYVPYIIPFLRHPRHNHVNLASIQPPSQSPSFHRQDHTSQSLAYPTPPTPTGNSFVPTALTPPPTNTALSSKLCWCESLPHVHLRGSSPANQPATNLSTQFTPTHTGHSISRSRQRLHVSIIRISVATANPYSANC